MGQTQIKNRQISGGLDGWIPAEKTWTYASADDPTFTFTVAADVTTKYSAGMRVKLTQSTVKYFIITAVSTFSGGNTTITVYGGTDYDLADAAITSPYYSTQKAPQGFPLSPAKWSETFSITGSQATPTSGTTYDMCNFSLPIGVWEAKHKFSLQGVCSASNTYIGLVGSLSTTSATIDTNYAGAMEASGPSSNRSIDLVMNMVVTLTATSKTTWYVVVKMVTDGTTLSVKVEAASHGAAIIATCAYL